MRTADLISRFVTAAGNIERTIVSTGWVRPSSVEVRGENLVFDYREPFQRVRPVAGMMHGFLRLADASDERIAAYARRWGALSVSPVDSPSGEFVNPDTDSFGEALLHGRTEWLGDWRAWVREARTLL